MGKDLALQSVIWDKCVEDLCRDTSLSCWASNSRGLCTTIYIATTLMVISKLIKSIEEPHTLISSFKMPSDSKVTYETSAMEHSQCTPQSLVGLKAEFMPL